MGQKAPSTATSHDVEDSVEDLTQAMEARSPFVIRSRQESIDALPLNVAKIG